tara:strand:+ start:5376 stop:5831 length:456 start_codon:yes stop_codon:yes gene_type:complete
MSRKSPRHTIGSHDPVLLPGFNKADVDKVVAACAEWLARHDEQEKLAKRWQRLESRLAREHRWFQLSERERAVLPEATQLDSISDRLDELYALNQKLLTILPKVVATTTHGLNCKLSVALALVHPEENKDAHTLIQSVLRDAEGSAQSHRE